MSTSPKSEGTFSSRDTAEQEELIRVTDEAIREKAAADAKERTERIERAKASIAELQDKIAALKLDLPDEPIIPDIATSVHSGTAGIPIGGAPIGPTSSFGVQSIDPKPPLSSTPISSFHDLIGVHDFLSHERSEIELEHSSMQVISKSDRLRLNASDKSKVYANFIKGSTNKFKASSTIVGLDEISTIENITSFAELRLELQKHITSISVHPVFLILKFDDKGILIDPDTVDGAPINLL